MSDENGRVKQQPDMEDPDLVCGEPLVENDEAYRKQHAAVKQQMEKAQQQDPANHLEEPRVGVYICRCGGNISDVVDVERVAEVARLIPGVATAKVHTFMCSDPGQHTISNDILQENLDRVVVASCSPFLHEQTFRGAVARANMNPYMYEHVNIREQASWAHRHDPEGATLKAIRMITAAVGKLRYSTPLDQIKLPNHRKALVIGGGIAGMRAAADLAGRGISVLLVESSERLGGHLNERGKVYPTETMASAIVADLILKVQNSDRIEVLLNSKVASVNGFIGNFRTVIEGPFGAAGVNSTIDATVGAIVMATGFRPYVPRDGEFLYHQDPSVLTTPEFIEFMQGIGSTSKEMVHRGRTIRGIAFFHCVGSRQLDGIHEPQPDGTLNTYCSRTCCSTILQQALSVRQRFPQVSVYDFHRDIRTYGRGEEDYYTDASKAGVVFFRYNGEEPIKVEPSGGRSKKDPPITVTVKDALTWGEELSVPVDMLVLGVGMMPGKIEDLVESIKLSTGEDHFLQEVHPKLRPVEVAVSGVLLAGTAQGPMNIQETLNAASAAAVKAAAMFAKEMVELNPYVAAIDASRCNGEAFCVTQCDYEGALQMVAVEVDGHTVQRAQVNAGLCVGCGACVAVCPHRAIDLNGWRLEQFEAMVDGLAADIPQTECTPELVNI
ncbi:MAG: CoB--CoM heterodisulfide reductase iron-sulfur subunit A family protein [Acidobacteriaceae bacterium]